MSNEKLASPGMPAGNHADARIAGFWRRIFALLIDMSVLALVGIALGLTDFRGLVELGQAGRLIGAPITLLYFGILNSAVGGGATLGKRWLNLQVVDRQGHGIPLTRSLLRTVVFWTPYYLNGVFYSKIFSSRFLNTTLGVADAVIVFGGMGIIFYFYVFNSRTRQSLHDLIAGTYVTTRESRGCPITAPLWRGHVAIAVSLALVITAAASVVLLYFFSAIGGGTFEQLTRLANSVQRRPGIAYAQAQVSAVYTPSGKHTLLVIVARLNDVPSSMETIQLDIANTILRLSPAILLGEQALAVNVSYGYDLGIFHWTVARNYVATPAQWLQRITARGDQQPI